MVNKDELQGYINYHHYCCYHYIHIWVKQMQGEAMLEKWTLLGQFGNALMPVLTIRWHYGALSPAVNGW